MSRPPAWWKKLKREVWPNALQSQSRRSLKRLVVEGEAYAARSRAEEEGLERIWRQGSGRRERPRTLRERLGYNKFTVLNELYHRGDERRTIVMVFASVGLRQSDAELKRLGWVRERDPEWWYVTKRGIGAIAGR